MVGKSPQIRKAERERMEIIRLYCGCLPCLLIGHLDRHATVEHVTDRGRRIGKNSEVHRHTIGLCGWHHFGHTNNHRTRHHMTTEFGPSLALGRRSFEAYFGDEVTVLIPVQDYLLELFAADPWQEYAVPSEIASLTRLRWIALNQG